MGRAARRLVIEYLDDGDVGAGKIKLGSDVIDLAVGAERAQRGVLPRSENSVRIAINGVGNADPTLVYWLHRGGHIPTLIEHAPTLRTGGYVIDFWGLGYEVAQRMGIEAALREAGYEVRALRAVDSTGRKQAHVSVDAYFDVVSQIRLDRWTQGRVALVGDAAACPSLLAGEGTGLAMLEGYVLAGELHAAHGDHVRAFAGYERRLRSFVEGKQDGALRMVGFFAAETKLGIWLRNLGMRAAQFPAVANLLVARSFRDDLNCRTTVPDERRPRCTLITRRTLITSLVRLAGGGLQRSGRELKWFSAH